MRRHFSSGAQRSIVILVHSDTDIVVMSHDLEETLTCARSDSVGNRILWCDVSSREFTHKSKLHSVLHVFTIFEAHDKSKMFNSYRVHLGEEGSASLELDRTVYLPEFNTGSVPLVAIFQEEADAIVMKPANSENLLVCNISPDSKQPNYTEPPREISLSEYNICQNDNLPLPGIDLCDIGDGYFLISGVGGENDELLTVYDSPHCAKHYQKRSPSAQIPSPNTKTVPKSSTYFHSQSARSPNGHFVILSRVNVTDLPGIMSYNFTVNLLPYSCSPPSTLTLIGKALPYAPLQAEYEESQVKLASDGPAPEFDSARSSKLALSYPYAPNYHTSIRAPEWSGHIRLLAETEEAYISSLCDKNVTPTELKFDILLCEFVQKRERLLIEYKNKTSNNKKHQTKLPDYLTANPSRLVLSRLKVTNISQRSLLSLLVRCFSNPQGFWPRISMFYLLRCANEVSSTMFPFSVVARSLSRGDLSMVEMIIDRIPDVREYELIEILRWANSAENGIWNLNGDNFAAEAQPLPVCRKKAMKTWIKEKILEEMGQNSRSGFRSAEYLQKKLISYNKKKRTRRNIPQIHTSCSTTSMRHLIYKVVLYNGSYCRDFVTQSLRSLLKINELLDITSWCICKITGIPAKNTGSTPSQLPTMMNTILNEITKNPESKNKPLDNLILRNTNAVENCLNALSVLILLFDSHFSTFLHSPELQNYIRELHDMVHRDVKVIGYLSKKLVGPIKNILDAIGRMKSEKLKRKSFADGSYTHNKRLRRMIDDCSGQSYKIERYII